MFYVGQKVVCVRDEYVEQHITKKNIYTIYAVDDLFGGMQMEEIKIRTDAAGYDWYFAANRFRPLVERKTSIEIFQRMLHPAGADA